MQTDRELTFLPHIGQVAERFIVEQLLTKPSLHTLCHTVKVLPTSCIVLFKSRPRVHREKVCQVFPDPPLSVLQDVTSSLDTLGTMINPHT